MTAHASRWTPALTAVVAMLAWLNATTASAVVKHRYTFNQGDANDSVGTAHGTVVDPGIPTAVFTGGQLDLSANNGQGSNGITEDAYVNLPNGIISGAAQSGTSGAVTLEFWATVAQQRTWQRFGDFGTSNNGEDTSASGSTSPYLLISPNSGRFADGLEITNHPASNAGEPNVGVPGPFPVGTQQHVVAVYDQTDTTAGPNGTMTLYHNGVLVGSNLIHADLGSLSALPDNNNWLGRSQWNDSTFDGSYNEFSVYDHALSGVEVAASFAAGPVPVPEPEVIALALIAIGAGVKLLRRRK